MRLLLLLFALLSPVIGGALILDTSEPANATQDVIQSGESTNMMDLRNEKRQSINSLIENGNLSTDYYTEPITPQPELKTLTIETCNGKIGHANFRLSPTMISQKNDLGIHSVIANGANVKLTGRATDEWIEIIYGKETGYIHKCWMNY